MDPEDNANLPSSETGDMTESEVTSDNILELLEAFLSDHKIEDADQLLSEENIKRFHDKTMDFVIVLSCYIKEEYFEKFPKVFHSSISFLERIALYGNPRETILQLLEHLKSFDLLGLTHSLTPLKTVLLRLPSSRFLKWSLDTVRGQLSKLLIDITKREEENPERIHTFTTNVTDIYNYICNFYKPFVNKVLYEISQTDKSESTHAALVQAKVSLSVFVLQLLGKPLACLDLEYDGSVKSAARSVAETLIEDLNILIPNLFEFLQYIENLEEAKICSRKVNDGCGDTSSDDEYGPETSQGVITGDYELGIISIGVLMYLIIAENVKIENVPCVYCTQYVFERGLYLTSAMLKEPEHFLVWKGLLLLKSVLERTRPCSVPQFVLDLPQNKSCVEALINIMVLSQVEKSRKLAAVIFRRYLFSFDYKGRYLLVFHLQHLVKHSGVLSYLITLFKDMIVESISNGDTTFFTGASFKNILTTFCNLKHGSKTDLIEIADEIIASLNLIRYLALRDDANFSGFWSVLDDIDKFFISPLSDGIVISRAHFTSKLNELNDESKSQTSEELDSKVDVFVGGEKLPNLPTENKIYIVTSALNSLDLMECLLTRLNECISERVKHRHVSQN